MAALDVKSGLQSIAAGSVLDIRPGTGEEWVINNLYYGGSVEINRTDGTNVLKFDSDLNFGGRIGTIYRCTNSQWLQIKNTGTTSILIGYDGVQTK
ncbi:hypothetical protein ACT8ZR_09315 [Neobacillus sp. M.A.Huq-85]